MSAGSSIEWTDATWSPVVGCSRVSPGCDGCYAVSMTRRLAAMGQEKYAGLVNPGKWHFNGVARLHTPDLDKPLRWRKPRRVFVNPMSDLFHEELSFEQIAAVLGVVAACPHLTFQVLTKRPEVAAEWYAWIASVRETEGSVGHFAERALGLEGQESARHFAAVNAAILRDDWPLPNLVLGTSVENQPTADLRIPEIFRCPAAVHFVSYEPALRPVDFTHIRERRFPTEPHIRESWIDALAGKRYHYRRADALSTEGYYQNDLPRLDWIIAGGESGPGARPPQAEWFRSVRDQCLEAGVPFFFKQWGKWAPYDQLPEETKRDLDASGAQLYTDPAPIRPLGLGKKRAGRELDGELWDQFPKEVRP